MKSNKNITLVMGQYGIFPNKKDITIETPAVQVCLALILKTSACTAIAHIDTPFHAESITKKMIASLKKEDPKGFSQISATLIGGDFGSMINSSSICNPIIETLKKAKIPYKHENYSFALPTLLLPLIYLGFRYIGGLNADESVLKTIFTTLLCLMAQALISSYVSSNSYDVAINLKSGEIKITRNDIRNCERIAENSDENGTDYLEKRYQLDPLDKSQARALELQDISEKMKF